MLMGCAVVSLPCGPPSEVEAYVSVVRDPTAQCKSLFSGQCARRGAS